MSSTSRKLYSGSTMTNACVFGPLLPVILGTANHLMKSSWYVVPVPCQTSKCWYKLQLPHEKLVLGFQVNNLEVSMNSFRSRSVALQLRHRPRIRRTPSAIRDSLQKNILARDYWTSRSLLFPPETSPPLPCAVAVCSGGRD